MKGNYFEAYDKISDSTMIVLKLKLGNGFFFFFPSCVTFKLDANIKKKLISIGEDY